ncbi:uncharacterized protein LOC135384671 [Ornithodoros turicata]|uniref:uncharacterized protein LOC135384671 n=1 Tax=Ornithodoros turicata TaxID=34597 RepID=UPI003138A39B
MVYEATLRIPDAFFPPSSPACPTDMTSYVDRLRSALGHLQSHPPRSCSPATLQHPLLQTTTNVFVRHDGVRKPLQPPYDGPYLVTHRGPKHFTRQIAGRTETVSVDRLKSALLDDQAYRPFSVTPAVPPHSSPSALPSTSTTHRRLVWFGLV